MKPYQKVIIQFLGISSRYTHIEYVARYEQNINPVSCNMFQQPLQKKRLLLQLRLVEQAVTQVPVGSM